MGCGNEHLSGATTINKQYRQPFAIDRDGVIGSTEECERNHVITTEQANPTG